MAKFRKKPVVIEAEQFFPDVEPWPRGVFFHDTHPGKHQYEHNGVRGNFCINTLEGGMIVSPGDWVITGVKGEIYPCKPDIFEATYEPADKPTMTLSEIVAQLRSCGYECEAGSLENNAAFIALAEMAN